MDGTTYGCVGVSLYVVSGSPVRIHDPSLTGYPNGLHKGVLVFVRPIPELAIVVITRAPHSAICLQRHAVAAG